MKNRILNFAATPLALALAILLAGCNKKEQAPPAPTTVAPAAGATIVSAEKNSFDEVTSKLDKGGSLYLYMSTEQTLSRLSKYIESLSNTVNSLPAGPVNHEAVARGFLVAGSLIKDSGIEHISGFGASSIARETNFYFSKIIVHHYPGQNDGLIWSAFGAKSHPLAELDLLPESTALANYTDLDVPLVWKTIRTEVARLGLPQADTQLAALPAQFKAQTGKNLDDLLASLGGGYGFILTLDESRTITLPIPGNPMEVPEPAIAIFFKVKSDAIFDLVNEKFFTNNPLVVKSTGPNLRSSTLKIPLPLPVDFSPTIARSGDYIFITSSENLLKEILDVQSGKTKGFKSTAEFQKLSQGIPLEGNNFTLISEKLSRTLAKAAQGALTNNAALLGSQAQSLRDMLGTNQGVYTFSVGINGPEGWEAIANGNHSMNAMFLPAAVGAVSLISAIAIPNFVRARDVSSENACINNLRLIDAAKQQWALENNKRNIDTPSIEDLKPYIGPTFPTCPDGGVYIIGAVGEKPRCTHPGHVLP